MPNDHRMRLDVTLNGDDGAKLARLARRARTPEAVLAGALLSYALDEADCDPLDVVALLDRDPGIFERAQVGLEQARSSETIALDDF
jgi:hypothetical protein